MVYPITCKRDILCFSVESFSVHYKEGTDDVQDLSAFLDSRFHCVGAFLFVIGFGFCFKSFSQISSIILYLSFP